MSPKSADIDSDLIARAVGGICLLEPQDFQWAHFGAAILAAHFFVADAALDVQTAGAVVTQATNLASRQAIWLRAPPKSRRADPASIMGSLEGNADRLTFLGHDLIFSSIALRAMQERPELATEANLDGLARLVESINQEPPGGPFAGWDDLEEAINRPDLTLPALDSTQMLAAATLRRFSEVGPVHPGLDQGVVYHALTHALAIVELEAMGFGRAAVRARTAQRTYLTLLSRRPDPAGALPRIKEDATDVTSFAWWSKDRRGRSDWLVGHVFKVPWAFRRLLDFAGRTAPHDLEPFLSYTLSES